MHGRVKTRTTAEQEEIKRKERLKKVEQYKSGMSAVFQKRQNGEKDEAGLVLSAKLLSGNPDIYTLWNIRREILLHLKSIKSSEDFTLKLEDELHLTEICLRTQPKSYGTWHHRCWVLDNMTDPPWKKELVLCDKYLTYDERNFHCWDYRRFIVQRSGVTPEEELKFTDEKIATNFSNYSAWHLRSNLLPQVYPDPEGSKPIEETQHKAELELVVNAAFTDPYDQSAWFYQRWLLGRAKPELKVTQVCVTKRMVCIALNQSISPASSKVKVEVMGTSDWETVDGEVSSCVWRKMYPVDKSPLTELSQESLTLYVDGEQVQTEMLSRGAEQVYHKGALMFHPPFSPGVTQVLCNVLESCQTLLQLEPDTKWPLITSVLLMQAIDRIKYREETLQHLKLLSKVDPLRANYYSDLKSRYTMEYALERWDTESDFCLVDSGLSALYHAQYMLMAQRVDLRGNSLQRSLPRLSCLQFCQVLILDDNKLENLKGFPSLPSIATLSLKKNKLCVLGDVEPHIRGCLALVTIHLDGNPLSSTHRFENGCFVSKS